uniref:DNA methyltransferase n=1 Tax=Streptococcus merionis TaxID=400065 RepID=UPI0026EC7D44
WVSDNPSARSGGSNSSFAIQNPKNGHIDYPPKGRYWAFSQSTFDEWVKIGKVIFKDEVKEGGRGFIVKKYLSELKSSYNTVNSLFGTDNQFMNQVATKHLRDDVFEGVDLFTSPKPLGFIKKLVKYSTDKSSLILDFFAGSATTADAVMQLNAEDGGQRRYILCTLDEAVADKSAAKEAGYETIDQISRERIRRAAKKIQAEHPETVGQQDFGFKAYRLDSSNFKDVSKTPDQFEQGNLFDSVDHIKDDRSSLDLLYQVMLSWGMELSLSIHKEVIDDCEVYDVDNGSLIACFDNGMSEALIQSIAKREPLRAVFKDQAFANSSAKINLEQIFKDHSPMTKVKVV